MRINVALPTCAVGFMLLSTNYLLAQIDPTDLSSISLGAKIVGPVGPEVETTIAFDDGGTITGIADLASSVSCDSRFAGDCSAGAVAGFDDVVYTYVHTVIPGVDLPNDPPFPAPDVVVPLDDVTEFRLNFPAHGFNGIAGYDFSEATAAVGGTPFTIVQVVDEAEPSQALQILSPRRANSPAPAHSSHRWAADCRAKLGSRQFPRCRHCCHRHAGLGWS